MTYKYDTERAALEALREKQQIESAALEKAERELAAIQEVEHNLATIRRRREQVNQDLQAARARTAATRRALDLPTPVYGGRTGLLAAAEELRRHTRRKEHHEDPRNEA